MSKAATDAPGHSEQLVELWSTGLVGRDHLAVDYRFVDVEHGRHLIGERLETTQDIAVARNEAATALLKIAEAPKPIVFEVEEPVGVVERLPSPARDDRLYAGKCHLADMARSADFVHEAGPWLQRCVPSLLQRETQTQQQGMRTAQPATRR